MDTSNTPRSRRTAPPVSLGAMIEAMEINFGHDMISKACKEDWLIFGHKDDEWEMKGKVTKDVLGKNYTILHGLLHINKGGIYKKTQLREAFDALDAKYHHRLSASHGKSWSDMESQLLHFMFMELRKHKRNCKTMARSPQWMKTLFELISDDAQISRSPSGSLEPRETNTPTAKPPWGRFPGMPGGSFSMRPRTPRSDDRPLIYFPGDSPSKKTPEKQTKTMDVGTKFYYNNLRRMAVKIKNGQVDFSIKETKAPSGMSTFTWSDGTTWQHQCGPEKGEGRKKKKSHQANEEPSDNEAPSQCTEDGGEKEEGEEAQENEENEHEEEPEQQTKQAEDLDTEAYEDEDETNMPEIHAAKKNNTQSAQKATAKSTQAPKSTTEHNSTKRPPSTSKPNGKSTAKPSPITRKSTSMAAEKNKKQKKLAEDYKCLPRHREYSKMWHSVKNACLAKGLSVLDARTKARRQAKAHCDAIFAKKR